MENETDYVYVYLKNQLDNVSNDQTIYSKRLLEYNIAKDSGYEALRELAIKWYSENDEAKEQNSQDKKYYKFGFWITITFFIMFAIWFLTKM